jgi:hypothetical protein
VQKVTCHEASILFSFSLSFLSGNTDAASEESWVIILLYNKTYKEQKKSCVCFKTGVSDSSTDVIYVTFAYLQIAAPQRQF